MKTEDKKKKPSNADKKKWENEFNKWEEMIAFETRPFKDRPNFQEWFGEIRKNYVHFGEFGFETNKKMKQLLFSNRKVFRDVCEYLINRKVMVY